MSYHSESEWELRSDWSNEGTLSSKIEIEHQLLDACVERDIDRLEAVYNENKDFWTRKWVLDSEEDDYDATSEAVILEWGFWGMGSTQKNKSTYIPVVEWMFTKLEHIHEEPEDIYNDFIYYSPEFLPYRTYFGFLMRLWNLWKHHVNLDHAMLSTASMKDTIWATHELVEHNYLLREDTPEFVSVFVTVVVNSNKHMNEMLTERQDLDAKVTKIQAAFRGWLWRKNVLWNPHTEIGRICLAMDAVKFTKS